MHSKRKIPDFATDEEAEEFVATADLTEYDLSEFVVAPIKFVRPAPNTFVPDDLLEKVRKRADQQGVSPDYFIERALEEAVEDTHC
ncbi:CopG family antitoxin [Enterovirga aerilata]|uniref:Ribbon-helix-helix protein, CopG family n=1 Tax=Enterovirga aerilata TaxID=2730920 RepID=A0A849I417_9HYPH|nr:CopG family antitoxin [Enterovirga sp. DB1703]NNM72404.1 ribbon-helix-helix protein, CopG family [Enterovirga sp. DB1703]